MAASFGSWPAETSLLAAEETFLINPDGEIDDPKTCGREGRSQNRRIPWNDCYRSPRPALRPSSSCRSNAAIVVRWRRTYWRLAC